MDKHTWKDKGLCLGYDVNLFFDTYEEDINKRHAVDAICKQCPVMKQCFAVGVTNKEWGVWGGVYLENGDISREFNRHKKKPEWSEIWKALTLENK